MAPLYALYTEAGGGGVEFTAVGGDVGFTEGWG